MHSVQVQRGGASDDENRIRAAGQESFDTALDEGLAVQFDQRFRLAEPRTLPRGQQNPGDCSAHGPQAYAFTLVTSIPNQEW